MEHGLKDRLSERMPGNREAGDGDRRQLIKTLSLAISTIQGLPSPRQEDLAVQRDAVEARLGHTADRSALVENAIEGILAFMPKEPLK